MSDEGYTSLETYYCPNINCTIKLNARDMDIGQCPQCGMSLILNEPIVKDNETGLFKNCRIRMKKKEIKPYKKENGEYKGGPY